MFTMHVQQTLRPCPFVQIVDILRHQQQIARPCRIQPCEGIMRGIGLYLLNTFATHIVKTQDKVGVAGKGFGRCHILDLMLLPQSACAAKGINAAFGANPSARQDDNVFDILAHLLSFIVTLNLSPVLNIVRPRNKVRARYMKIGIIGSAGRMGQALVDAIVADGHAHAGGVDKDGDLAALIAASDVLVDFSSPHGLEASLDACVAADKPIVIGTTGLEERHHFLIDDAARDIAILQTGNTSLGVNMLAALVEQAARQLGADWDIEILEMHHRHKVDAPSGTALLLGEAAAKGRAVDLKEHSDRGRDGITGARKAGDIGFAALRGGSVAGDHTVIFATDNERIELVHRAENRSIFARGAVKAAVWLTRQTPGRYNMQEVLGL
jgi:4-hydroxy-tetrahydrodipicolinate reductase